MLLWVCSLSRLYYLFLFLAQVRADIAASFQKVAVDHLAARCRRAAEWAKEDLPELKHLVVAGGVAANKKVRAVLGKIAEEAGLELVCPAPSLCTDNGIMVAWAGLERCGSPWPLQQYASVWHPPTFVSGGICSLVGILRGVFYREHGFHSIA